MRTANPIRRLAVIAVALALAHAAPREARADISYGFAEQTISGLSITPTVTLPDGITTSTQDSTTFNGSGGSNSNPLDALQSFQGGSPASGQNFFARYAPGNPPVSPTSPPSFTRADALIASIASGSNSSSVVAESFIGTGPGSPTSETGSGGLSASFSFTVGTATALTIAYTFANDLFVFTTGAGNATANYHFNITIKDAAGNPVFNSSTTNTNLSLTAPPPGGEVIRTGTESVVTPTLSVGTLYSITFSSTAQSTVTAVPEPASLAMLAVGSLIAIGYRRSRRRAA